VSLFLRRRILTGGFVPIRAVGGDDVFDEEIAGVLYRIHVFTTVGSSQAFEVLSLGDAEDAGINLAEYVVVGGGGAGGGDNHGGGGGAGGYRSSVVGEQSGRNSPAEARVTLQEQTYTVVVGAGGVSLGLRQLNPDTAEASTFGTVTALGGGEGGPCCGISGAPGGSGGGGGSSGSTAGQGASGTAGQGFDGGNAFATTDRRNGGGGGGAAQNGATATSGGAGNGGNGIQSNITGTPTYRAGGGGGGNGGPISSPNGVGGLGGGGNGGSVETVQPGENGTGGGGGGLQFGSVEGGAGGSGIVIVRYPLVPV